MIIFYNFFILAYFITMSIYSSSIRSHVVDPQFHSENRTEFRLNHIGGSFLPTLRLGNVGLSKTGTNNFYHPGAGAASVISRIRLMDGTEELDGLRLAGPWLSFKGLIKSNSENVNVMRNLEGGELGWSAGATGELLSNQPKVIREGEEATLSSIDLRDTFSFLNSVSHLSMSLFKNLRVIVEYVPNSKPELLVENISQVAGLKKSVPILIVDQITDESLVATLDKQLTSATWLAIETDQATIAKVPGVEGQAVATSVEQRSSLRINGFQNKAVSRVMISKTFTDADAYKYVDAAGDVKIKGLSGYGSRRMHRERFNMRVNGSNLLSGDGLVTPAQETMMLSDTWGELNMCPGQNIESVGLDTKYDLTKADPVIATIVGNAPKNFVGTNVTQPSVLTNSGVLDAAGTSWTTPPTAQTGYWCGNSAFIGLPVHNRVVDMQIDMVRTGTPSSVASSPTAFDAGTIASAGNYLPMTLTVFAEVSKSLQVSGMDYKVVYN